MAKFDLYQTVTDKIVSAIEEGGTLPWVKPWKTKGGPRNGVSGRHYKGMNTLLLTIAGTAYGSNDWFTYNGASKLGGTVRKGEKGTLVVYWSLIKKKNEKGVEETFPFLRYFNVFNRGQIDGLPDPKIEPETFNPIERAETFMRDTGATILHGGDRAVYNLLADTVTLPTPASFVDPAAYYATAFHELVHWTGHKSRLDRITPSSFGSENYAKEELVAELGAAFLCAEYGITGMTQHPEYIASWLTALKNDKKFIFQAASAATKAAAFLTPTEGEEAEPEE